MARERYKDRANNTMSTFRGTLEIMNGKIWKCDPNKHVKGILLSIISAEITMNDKKDKAFTIQAFTYQRCKNNNESYGTNDLR